MKVADRILAGVSEVTSQLRIKLAHPLTLSGGMAQFPEDAEEPTALVENAKTALISAKIMGGARIIKFDDLEE